MSILRNYTTIIIAALVIFVTPPSLVYAAEDCPQCVADFALYNPSYENDGVWEEEVKALKAMFKSYGWSYATITNKDINSGKLKSGADQNYRALIGPGGWAYYREIAINTSGEDSIRDFISAGGNYVGFCAGAYWMANTVLFADPATGGSGTYNQTSDYITYNDVYHVKLFSGAAQGPFGWFPWSTTNAVLDEVSINTDNSTMQKIKLPSTTRFFYAGGPFFTFTTKPTGYKVWAKAKMPNNVSSAASTGNKKPTVIKFKYNSGKVVLFSYHPEILINSSVDNVTLSDYYDEAALSWNTGNQTQDQINLDSWNIVHAALQVGTNESVTPLTALPK